MPTRDAIYLAQKQNLDLVEMSPNAEPPVCRIMDYGKFRYDEGMKRKAARKQQKQQVVKEIKFHANVDRHDLEVKMKQMLYALAFMLLKIIHTIGHNIIITSLKKLLSMIKTEEVI